MYYPEGMKDQDLEKPANNTSMPTKLLYNSHNIRHLGQNAGERSNTVGNWTIVLQRSDRAPDDPITRDGAVR